MESRQASVVTKALPCAEIVVLYKTKARNSVQLQAGAGSSGQYFSFCSIPQSTCLRAVDEQAMFFFPFSENRISFDSPGDGALF